MKIAAKLSVVFALMIGLIGCEAESSAFVGKWVEQGSSSRPPHTLEISKNDGIYTVSETISIGGIVKVVQDVAKVESDTALSMKNGFRTLILKDGVLHYMARSFAKTSN